MAIMVASKFMKKSAVAALLGINKTVVQDWVKLQGLKTHKVKGEKFVLINYDDLRLFILKKRKKKFYRIIEKCDELEKKVIEQGLHFADRKEHESEAK